MIHTLPRGAGHLGRWAKGQWDKARPPGEISLVTGPSPEGKSFQVKGSGLMPTNEMGPHGWNGSDIIVPMLPGTHSASCPKAVGSSCGL